MDAVIQPRLPAWDSGESLVERVMSAMWLYMMTYRLADEEKIDETSVWYALFLELVIWICCCYIFIIFIRHFLLSGDPYPEKRHKQHFYFQLSDQTYVPGNIDFQIFQLGANYLVPT